MAAGCGVSGCGARAKEEEGIDKADNAGDERGSGGKRSAAEKDSSTRPRATGDRMIGWGAYVRSMLSGLPLLCGLS
jgi:hypothetical protein